MGSAWALAVLDAPAPLTCTVRDVGGLLGDLELRALSIPGLPASLRPVGLALGQGDSAVEIAVVAASEAPSAPHLRDAWKKRWGNRSSPVLLVAVWNDTAVLCGPSEPNPPVSDAVSLDLADRICRAALAEPDRHAARKFLGAALAALDTPLSGLRNEGLFATHHLQHNAPRRSDWASASGNARPLLNLREEGLLRGLGYQIERTNMPCVLLRHGASKVGLAVLVDRGTNVEAPSDLFRGISPVSYGLAKADEENLPYVLVLEGPTLRLYATSPGVGAGRRGRTETFVEARLDLLAVERSAYLWLLFSAEALSRGGAVEKLLEESRSFAADVGIRLRERIYADVVPKLATGVARAMQVRPNAEHLRETYEIALTILFRLLFLAYAEDRGLLPYVGNDEYRRRSLKTKARELASRNAAMEWDELPTYWNEVLALFEAVDKGKAAWGVPAYNGGLFSSDAAVSAHGAHIGNLELPDDVIGPVLSGLLVDPATPEGTGPVDFRSLGVREFGTIYEGLLESDLAVAEADLTTGASGEYRPTRRASEKVIVRDGEVYLHNKSGARKATGSYFTKPFVVDHLLDQALEPALKEHLERLDSFDDDRASARFFDFRVADLAMGSGHFLVAAVDRIERGLSGYLARRPLRGVGDELARLRRAAADAAKAVGVVVDVEDSQLLRRQIARRCIFGVDLNPMAVDLARLSLWIHTFVPGLPLSFLDHGLVRGNSLVGVATIDEAVEGLGGGRLFGHGVKELLRAGEADLARLGRISDADHAEIAEARRAAKDARKKVEPLRQVFDYVVAHRIDPTLPEAFEQAKDARAALKAILKPESQAKVRAALRAIPPTHFPVAFPEVFLHDRPGFDVILGNPPWEEVTLERDRFWGRHIPGLQGMPQDEREKLIKKWERHRDDLREEYERERDEVDALGKVLLSAGYPGMGEGDPDLYKAFVWRFWNLAAPDGHIGVVLPRVVFQAKGSAEFRQALFERGEMNDLTFVQNSGGWVFEDVHQQYTIVLAALKRTNRPSDIVPLRGPYISLPRFLARTEVDGTRFTKGDVLGWTDTAALPLLPSEQSGSVFAQLRKSPRLDLSTPEQWRARPYREFHATDDKQKGAKGYINVMATVCPTGFWPVFKGESFDIWESDTGRYYGYANPEVALLELERRMLAGLKRSDSPWVEFKAGSNRARSVATLPCQKPRIAIRDVTNRTNTRTVISALVPGHVFLTNAAPYLLWPRGDEQDQAYLLGILCSRPLDWYARRFVEIHCNYHILNAFPVPRPSRTSPLWKRVVALAGRLACRDRSFAAFARAVSVEHGVLSADEKADMIHELDAVVAHLYGLDAGQLGHIFETFHEGWDYGPDLEATIRHFETWAKKA